MVNLPNVARGWPFKASQPDIIGPVTSDQWLQLWMTWLSAVVGGLVTLVGVWLALRHGRKQQQAETELVRELDRTQAARTELQNRRTVLEYWDETVVELMQWLISKLGHGISPAHLVDRPDFIEEYAQSPARMVLDHWVQRSPEPGSREPGVIWSIHQQIKSVSASARNWPRGGPLLRTVRKVKVNVLGW